MSARNHLKRKLLANVTVPTVPATASTMKSRGGHDRDRHFAAAACL